MNRTILLLVVIVLTGGNINGQGFYKDIFMDGGIRLTSREDLPAARRLNMSIEHFVTGKGTPESPLTRQDTVMQELLLCGSEIDHNGVLLYPDGQPRFRMIYTNGGKATQHGISLTERGLDNIRTFVRNGGSYVGTCAGMFLATKGTATSTSLPHEGYLHIWPGLAGFTRLAKTPTGHFVEPGSALLNYYDFGGDMHIDSVYHNGGGFILQTAEIPKGTEILLRYDYKPLIKDSISIHNQISSWAWKESENTGRIVLIGSHPEGYSSGERLDLMSSLILYGMDGLGEPIIKGELKQGEIRKMVKSTLDNDPAYTKIGDKQYHHFTVNIPEGAKNITVKLNGTPGYDLNLFMRKEGPAFINEATIINIAKGSDKKIVKKTLEKGIWYIAVECASTVEVVNSQWGEMYSGNLSVLNGVPYTISVNWKNNSQ